MHYEVLQRLPQIFSKKYNNPYHYYLEKPAAAVTQLGECTAEDRDAEGSSPSRGISIIDENQFIIFF